MDTYDLFEQQSTDPFDAPIPGEGLTSDPNTPKPWEQPPEFTDVTEALQETFLNITDGEVYVDLLDSIREQTPLDMMVQTILFGGYMRGKWNTDLMLLMVEPMLYLLIALAEHNGIFEYTVYDGEEDDMTDEEAAQLLEDDIKRMQPQPKLLKQPSEVIPDSLLSKIENAPVMSEAEGEM
jgi:hypothetical protein